MRYATLAICALLACTEKKTDSAKEPPVAVRLIAPPTPKPEKKVASPQLAREIGSAPVATERAPMQAAKAASNKGVLGVLGSGVGGGGTGTGSGTGMGMGMGTFGARGHAAGTIGYAQGSGGLGLRGRGGARVIVNDPSAGGEGYTNYGVNGWQTTGFDHLSTFAVDVDTGSYTLARAKLKGGVLPPVDSVRVEEFLNYFRWSYPSPTAEDGPLAVHLDAAPSPFSPGKHLLRVGVQGKRLDIGARKTAHLTFLVDVSGSMQSTDKLPLAKRALRMLVDSLRDGDTVAMVTYAGGTRVVLTPTGMEKKAQIHQAIEDLQAGGSTAMAGGIQLAYQQAEKTLSSGSESRVIIVSDGDANVGSRDPKEILSLISGKVKEGITCTTLGFGMGNYQDTMMEQFANKGNGNHYYVDSLFEARRIFEGQLGGTLEVIAKDVKLQVDFNPDFVKGYRLVGYENRDIADADFRNDRVDAGEIGAGHTVTALYEVELKPGAGARSPLSGDATASQRATDPDLTGGRQDAVLVTVRVRAKAPKGADATEKAFKFKASQLHASFDQAPKDLRFAAAVMGAAEIFRQSPYAKSWSYDLVTEIAKSAAGNAERDEFVSLLKQAKSIVSTVAVR